MNGKRRIHNAVGDIIFLHAALPVILAFRFSLRRCAVA
jgi:hypothetical protein